MLQSIVVSVVITTNVYRNLLEEHTHAKLLPHLQPDIV